MEIMLLNVLQEFGLPVALVVFFTWQSWKRESRMNERLSTLEQDYTRTLKDLVAQCTKVIAENTAVMSRLEGCLTKSTKEGDKKRH